MKNRTIHLSKPLYELLPYGYVLSGIAGIVCAYFLLHEIWANVALVLGVACMLGGMVILLKRRDARVTRAQYRGGALDHPETFLEDPDAFRGPDQEKKAEGAG